MAIHSTLLFLAVPDSLKEELRHFQEGFAVDSSILLPVELGEGETVLDPEKLSWEMILSAMIRVVSAPFEEYAADIQPSWIDYYRRFVLAVKPEIYNEFTGAAIVKAKNGDFDMALEITAALEGLFPNAPGVLLNKALILEDKADALEKAGRKDAEETDQKALEAYNRVLAIEPVLADALFNAGFFFIRRKDYSRARECFSAYISEADDGQKKEKAQALVKDIETRGLDDEGFKEAVDLIRAGDDQGALDKIRDFLERRPKVWNGWFVLGWALRRLGRWQDGLDSFRKVIELGGGNNDTRNEMAICLMELGDLDAARNELEAALTEEPENIKIISNLGVLALKSGDDAEAAAFFRTVLELDPEDPIAKRYFEGPE
jgi:tetratricopeptide (TPR) repeat protein